ncbi:MAG TPA: bifunctional phosphopantothenoylcysteine decarboxylase/phosphopantothenate--cysteine ligase CoaBC, partial [Segetibacter sp.]
SSGADVRVILTPSAKNFVSALTLSTLSKNKVLSDLSDEDTWTNHVFLGRWAEVMLIAPLSCNSLAKMATGVCDNLLIATYLSATCPVVTAPAMDEDMWNHPSTRENIKLLKQYGNHVVPVGLGELASGLFGEGRMAEPEDILIYLAENFFRTDVLKGKKALVSAGPTFEAIDPVRYIGNHSSGKMGIAIAEVLYSNGADVELVCGPINNKVKYKGIKITSVTSAEEMYEACIRLYDFSDITVMAAAVADYTPAKVASEKIKKEEGNLEIILTKTKDILQTMGSRKKDHQFLVGFALETSNETENAINKLVNKNADLIVLNSLRDKFAGFGKDTNKVTVFEKSGASHSFEAKSKTLVAADIVQLIIMQLK